jgi:uncharacterized protein (UPF0210 family)
MKIRSITFFFHPGHQQNFLSQLAVEAKQLKDTFQKNGIEVQTMRLATTPHQEWLPQSINGKLDIVKKLETDAATYGFAYLSIGPASVDDETSNTLIPELLKETENVFVTAMIADRIHGVSLPAVKRAAEIIYKAKNITSDGFTNLRFAALANVPAEIPFFPTAYHHGIEPAFAIAVECADEAVGAFSEANTLEQARKLLLSRLETHASKMQSIIDGFHGNPNLVFTGFDFSLAPFPNDQCSLGKALELLGVPRVGDSGTLAAAAFIADTLDRGTWLRSGFNGLMLPVLEDSILAKRSIEQTLTLKDLLLSSAVCGIGLDTVPLPGDISQENIYAILLDVAALSIRLNKPLTARLMPVPGLNPGEKTSFDFAYFENGAALAVSDQTLSGKFNGDESYSMSTRHAYHENWKTKSR